MKTKLQIFFTSLFTLLTISAHAYALWDYSNLISNHRDFNLERQLLTEIKTKLPNLPQGISYFYFDDGRRHEEMYNTLYLGFSTKMAVLYEIPYPSKTIKPPHFTTSKEEILMIASTGEPLLKHGYEKKPLPQENIFAFRIDENKLKEIKEEIFTNNKN